MQTEAAPSNTAERSDGVRGFVERTLGEPVSKSELVVALVRVWIGWHPDLSRRQIEDALRARSTEAPPTPAMRHAAERARIVAALEKCGWNKVKAALELGMPRRSLYRRMQRYGLLG